jgi:hypothetical protein
LPGSALHHDSLNLFNLHSCDYRCHHAWLVLWDGLTDYFPRLTSNYHPPYLHLPSSWNYRQEALSSARILSNALLTL